MFLEVGGQDGLDDQEAKAFEVHVVQTGQKVVLGPRHEQIPGGRCVMILQHRTIIIKNSLQRHKTAVRRFMYFKAPEHREQL